MTAQNLPATAAEYGRASRAAQREAIAAIRRQWRRMGGDFDASWSFVAPVVAAIIGQSQRRVAVLADEYIPAVLEETGQLWAVPAAAPTNLDAFVGVTGAGTAVADQIAAAPIRAKQAVAQGATQHQALLAAGSWLTRAAGTILSDTGRAVETTAMATRRTGGYVRMLNPPSCRLCVPLAGKWFSKNQGFPRHPGCDCRHIPASEGIAGDWTLDIDSYLQSLDKAGQIKLLGSKANHEAWAEYGANPTTILNAYQRGNLRTAQDRYGRTVKYTTNAAGRRSLRTYEMRNASRLDRDAGWVRKEDGKTGLVRRMPETILATTQGRDRILHQLRFYGWIG